MKRNSFFLIIFILFVIFVIPNRANAAKAIFYYDSGLVDSSIYTNPSSYLSSKNFATEGHANWNNDTIYSSLHNFEVVVLATHGNPGLQEMNKTLFGALHGNGTTYKSVDQMDADAKKVKMAIYYGCRTGVVGYYGDLPGETVNKGAQTAVAWTVDTYSNEIKEWNRLFFEKASSDTIVEAYRHADYWLRAKRGNAAGDRMQLNRNEKGNIYGYIY